MTVTLPGPGRLSRGEARWNPLFVMAKEDGHWRLVACQNTGVLAS
jgi:hypothetical protein